jgi:small subunit ribosomal protein S3
MTHVVHPYSHRLGIIRDWKSRWFADKKTYVENLRGDVLLREFLTKKLRGMYISSIQIERDQNTMRVMIHTSRPGMVIGRQGEGMQKIRTAIGRFSRTRKIVLPVDFKLDVVEVQNPEMDAAIVAAMVAEGLEKRLPFRRVLKQTIEKTMAARGVQGAKITLGGRLGGADMARKESIKKGGIPLQTLRADIDFARERANMTYGVIGIKVWIYKGLVFDEKDNKNQPNQNQ